MQAFLEVISRRPFATRLIASAVCALCVSYPVQAADWPQWRGPNRDGISTETGWKTAWPAEGPKALWKLNVGPGCSSFAVVGDRVFTMGNKQETDSLYCLDAKTGKILWQYSYPAPVDPTLFKGGPCATPTVDGNSVFTLGRRGQLFCFDAATGKVVWTKDLPKEFGPAGLKWGYTGSPLVLNNLLILDVGVKGASAVALDKATGKVIWQAGDDGGGYSSPVPFDHDGKKCLAHFNNFGLVVRAAADGKELFRFPWTTPTDVKPTTPIISGDKVFISTGYGHGGKLLQMSPSGLSPLWETKAMSNKINSSVLWQGNLYGFDETRLTCIDFATGALKWKQEGLGMGSLTLADGKLLVLAEDGNLVIAEASPVAYKEIAKTPAVPAGSWVIPVLANGKIYCRNNLGDIVCLDVAQNP